MKLGTTLMSLWMNFRQVMGATGPPPSTLLDDLVSYWPLNEVSGTRYDVVGENHLTDNNTVGAVLRGPEGTVAQLVKANSESLSHAAGIVPSTFSFSMWIKPDSSVWATDTGVLSLDDAGNRGIVFNMFASGDINVWRIGAGYANSMTTSKAIMNSWNHLVFVEDRANSRLDVYINGVKNALGSDGSATAVANSTLTLGHWFAGAYAQGSMAAVGMWNVPLSDADVLTLMNSYHGLRYADLPAGLQTGLVSWWELDEVSGVRYDSHGSNDLTDNNTVGSATAVSGAMDGAAASFVAANSEYLSNTSVAIDPSAWTFAHWVKMPSGGGNGIPVDIQNLFYYWPSLDQVYVYGTPTTDIGSPPPADGSWHLMVVWQDGNTAGVQVDGGTPETAVLTPKAAANWNMRFVHPSFLLDCAVDEPAIWDRVLTADERAELFNLGRGRFYDFS